MNPLINLVLLVPALLIIGTIILMRIKGRLENTVYRYRHEGLVLQTSLTLLRVRRGRKKRRITLGLAILTNERLIILNWHERIMYNCIFRSETADTCSLRVSPNKKSIFVTSDSIPEEISLPVRNADAWELEFSRLCAAHRLQ